MGIRIPTDDADRTLTKIEELYGQYESLSNDKKRKPYLEGILYLAERQRTNPWDKILSFKIALKDEAFFSRELVRIENRISHGKYIIMWKGKLDELEMLIQELISEKLIINQFADVKQFITRYFENNERKNFYNDSYSINYYDKNKISWNGTQKQLCWLIHILGKEKKIHINMKRMYKFLCDHFCNKNGKNLNRKYLQELQYRENTKSKPLERICKILSRIFPNMKIPDIR